MFAVFSYIKPTLLEVSRIGVGQAPLVLALFGLGSVAGNLIGAIVVLGPALQIRLMDVADDAQTLAAALNHSAFNFANALGAMLGGGAIAAGWGWSSLGWVGASLAVGGLLVFGVSYALQRNAVRI